MRSEESWNWPKLQGRGGEIEVVAVVQYPDGDATLRLREEPARLALMLQTWVLEAHRLV